MTMNRKLAENLQLTMGNLVGFIKEANLPEKEVGDVLKVASAFTKMMIEAQDVLGINRGQTVLLKNVINTMMDSAIDAHKDCECAGGKFGFQQQPQTNCRPSLNDVFNNDDLHIEVKGHGQSVYGISINGFDLSQEQWESPMVQAMAKESGLLAEINKRGSKVELPRTKGMMN